MDFSKELDWDGGMAEAMPFQRVGEPQDDPFKNSGGNKGKSRSFTPLKKAAPFRMTSLRCGSCTG
jgi:hypothetical protein